MLKISTIQLSKEEVREAVIDYMEKKGIKRDTIKECNHDIHGISFNLKPEEMKDK